MGYQYDLLKNLAGYLDLALEIQVDKNLNEAFNDLTQYNCDILAINLTITPDREKLFNFTLPIGQTKQVIVQLSPEKWKKKAPDYQGCHLIDSIQKMADKTFYVVKGSAYYTRLKEIEQEIGDTIHIIEMENMDSEELISLVARGEIEYCVTDNDIAMVGKTYYPYLDISTVVSPTQYLAWAVNKNNTTLLLKINEWINETLASDWHAVIYNKYFKDPKVSKRGQSPYQSFNGGQISAYDAAIKKYSKHIDWDWRLLASLIYQESHFDPKVKSWSGAFGLMQLMPQTAEHFGVDTLSSPEAQIKAGVKFIKWLNKHLKDSIADDNERIKFILAAYNVGLGHIMDARRLAKKYGKEPNIWFDHVDFFLLHKSDPKYYDRFLVKSGYCRGEETYNFVKEVMERYQAYSTLFPSE
jgi:membrane-bound lytic murein transglycosylase F